MNEDFDLGHGVTGAWATDRAGRVIALLEGHEHEYEDGTRSTHYGNVPIDPEYFPDSPHWTIEAGTAGSFEGLTLSPSILCPTCGNHGWIRNGRWEPA